VGPSPVRPDEFVLNYLDKETNQHHKATFKAIDRASDVWVETLQALITKLHENHKEKRERKQGR